MSEQVQESLKTDNAQVTPDAKSVDQVVDAKVAEAKKETSPAATNEAAAKPSESKTADKPDGEKTPEPKLELKLPEGALLKPEHVEQIASLAKEQGLSNAQAQAILEREAAMAADTAKAQQAEFDRIKDEWRQRASEDKEIGGSAFKENVENAFRALNAYGSQALRDALDSTGFGNHPELIRVFSRIGKDMAEDKFVHSKGQSVTNKDHAKVLYGDMK